ncbi:MAG: enoyl-CoA hydratase/isomerase family protein [Syntrophaceae bacterium]|jgi:enoyl-CoA hydratase|nr:enoyl-CoA hydratase/isomerase family protein [Syntrophaceae bacterium]
MDYQYLLLDIQEGIARITFNRPKVLNAMSYDVMSELACALYACDQDEAVKALVLTGAGDKAFVAGADISQMQNATPVEITKMMELGQNTLRFLETMGKPSIAAVNGFALGGGTEIAMACDIRIASEKAVFGQPEILIGILPGWGGTQRLPRLVGMGIAKEMILAGGQINARRAYEIGLVNKVVPPDELLGEAEKMAKKFALLPGFALKMAKNAMNYGFDTSIDNGVKIELGAVAECFSTQDQKEGMKAFLEKRKPNFVGK